MGIGKKLLILGCSASAACALLLMIVAAPAISSIIFSGNALCVPGLSIKCYESDCGGYFLRCGRNTLYDVPADKVCYRGALLAVERTDLYSCSFTVNSLNSTTNLRMRNPIRGSCNEQLCGITCAGQAKCSCICPYETWGPVFCRSTSKNYRNANVASCCGASNCNSLPPLLWETLEFWPRQFIEHFASLTEDILKAFTFQSVPSDSLSCCGNAGSFQLCNC